VPTIRSRPDRRAVGRVPTSISASSTERRPEWDFFGKRTKKASDGLRRLRPADLTGSGVRRLPLMILDLMGTVARACGFLVVGGPHHRYEAPPWRDLTTPLVLAYRTFVRATTPPPASTPSDRPTKHVQRGIRSRSRAARSNGLVDLIGSVRRRDGSIGSRASDVRRGPRRLLRCRHPLRRCSAARHGVRPDF